MANKLEILLNQLPEMIKTDDGIETHLSIFKYREVDNTLGWGISYTRDNEVFISSASDDLRTALEDILSKIGDKRITKKTHTPKKVK
jgi:hypothetical protein